MITFAQIGRSSRYPAVVAVTLIAMGAALKPEEVARVPAAVAGDDPIPAPTTKLDFFRGGSQPDGSYEQILSSRNCGFCHDGEDPLLVINKPWEGSMHAQSARDMLWFACLTIAEQDAPFVGDMCIRCHVPRAWIMGRSDPTDGSNINRSDRDSVNCHFCHRMVDPFYKPGISPEIDEEILENIEELPVTNGSASFVLDPLDRHRGKRADPENPHTRILSPFHEDSAICETCHDVSNPVLDRQPDDTYVANEFDQPHPTGNKYDMFPGERTFSEWSVSQYAREGVDAEGRFGGNKRVVRSCQDCHMPDTTGRGVDGGPIREDSADHGMYGGGTWMPRVVANLYPDEVDVAALERGMAESESMLQRAASLELTQSGDLAMVRVINECGHKLPTGQPEGRQMWLNVRFFNGEGDMIAERGAYDSETARPDVSNTEMYEIVVGIDEAVAEATGLPVGPTHHIAFCNTLYKDTRIPPRGATNEELRRVQSPVMGAAYPDGQYWDDTQFAIPVGAMRVEFALYYKTASTEFIEFLRDANRTNDAGQILYDQWEITGKSPPVRMVSQSLDLAAFQIGDFNNDNRIDHDDFGPFVDCMEGPGSGPVEPPCRPADIDGDDDIDARDFARFQARFNDGA